MNPDNCRPATLGRLITYIRKNTRRLLAGIFFLLLGTCVALVMLLFVIVTIPAIALRVIVNYVILPCYLRKKYGFTKPVTSSFGFGIAYAAEYLSCLRHSRSSRNVILVSNVVQGHIPYDECSERVLNGLVKPKTRSENESSSVKEFPEFTEYVESWMGYTFWKTDEKFDILNHLTCHQFSDDVDLDQACSNIFEELANKKFVPRRSPWEIHVVYGKMNGVQRTIFLTRIHHVFGDGLSVTSMGIQGLFGVRLEDYYKKPSDPSSSSSRKPEEKKKHKNFLTVTLLTIQLIIGLLYDIGCMSSFVLWRANVNTPLHVPDDRKMWKQLYGRSEFIPMEKVKFIKNKLGVSFSAVLTSSMAASIAQLIKNKSGEKETKNFLSASPKLLSVGPMDHLTNHVTGTAYKTPVQFEMDPIDRLLECDKIMQRVNPSLFNTVFRFLTYILSFHITPIAQFGLRNTMFGASLSNFPGPDDEIKLKNGSKIVEISAAVGGFEGPTGIMILIFSYANQFRFSLMAENAVVNRDELTQFIKRMEEEIDVLHEITQLQNVGRLAEFQPKSTGNKNLHIKVEN